MKGITQEIAKGIADGKKAFQGPKTVQVDIIGICNNTCIGCWVHSPFVQNPPRDKGTVVSFQKAARLIEDLSSLGTEEIFLSGAGEPFMHPQIREIIALIKSKGMRLNIITNFLCVDESAAAALVDSGVDLITASIWAGTAESYARTHPGKGETEFSLIKKNIRFLVDARLKRGAVLPKIKMYNVICNRNCGDIAAMVDYAVETGIDFIEFQIMDIMPEISGFALSSEDAAEIKRQFQFLLAHKNLHLRKLERSDVRAVEELKEFPGRFFVLPEGFEFREIIARKSGSDEDVAYSLVCPRSICSTHSSRNPLIEEEKGELSFTLKKEICAQCPDFHASCPVSGDAQMRFHYLKLLGAGTFMRRLQSADMYGNLYERELIERLPCYAGWTYSRVLSTGEVIPCCKSQGKPLGNINLEDFPRIWNSEKYREFRDMAKNACKSEEYFRPINCFKSCDNVGMNLEIRDSLLRGKSVPAEEKPEERSEQGSSGLPADYDIRVLIASETYREGNFNRWRHQFGRGIMIDGGFERGFGVYTVELPEDGEYELWALYASDESRPVKLFWDGILLSDNALTHKSGGWTGEFLLWFKEAQARAEAGKHVLRVEVTGGVIPHIHSFALIKKEAVHAKKGALFTKETYFRASPVRSFVDKARSIGFINSGKHLVKHIVSGRLVDNYLDIVGIFNGRYAFKGPFHVQIDVTNDCNNDCIGCWCNSPLLEEKKVPLSTKKQTLPLGIVKELLEELARMGTKEIYFSGGGEPFMHPRIMDILEYAKQKNFVCYVNTNFTLLDKEKLSRIIDIGVDHLTVSTWVADPETYAKTHPNKDEKTFLTMLENLKFLNIRKRKFPYIKLYNVIFNMNYRELKGMIRVAQETGSESLEFTLIDTIPGKTDSLLLDEQQIAELQETASEIARGVDRTGAYDGVILFRFDSFLRRIASQSDVGKATYDRNIIDTMPCYIGWSFARIIANGDVNACLKAHRIPTGNLYAERFSSIWNNTKQIEFRAKTLVLEKKDPFFRSIGNDPCIQEAGCYKSCDDIGRNTYIHNRIMSLTPVERMVLKFAAKVKRPLDIKYFTEIRGENKVFEGVIHGRKAFTGPEQAVVDITNRCSLQCAGCWLYSSFLKEKPENGWLRQEISGEKAKALIDALAACGTKRIRFTGGGEPLLHPEIMELIAYSKKKGLITCLTTNLAVCSENEAGELASLGLDELAVSVWASNAETYMRTHGGAGKSLFAKVQANLRAVIEKKKTGPVVTLCNVISNLNYDDVLNMFEFAVASRADAVYFTHVDTLPGTEILLLNEEQKIEVVRQSEEIFRRKEKGDCPLILEYFDGFTGRLKNKGSSTGLYDSLRINSIPCFAGWNFTRILADGSVAPCCRGVKKIMGNINTQDFQGIWHSVRYNEFRSKAKYSPKTDAYFEKIGCMKMCDNLMHNEITDKAVKMYERR
ncbi:MAG: radical SAM protein [Candidatus Omnitrophica bacterium]|nr:radical SAM protein [Candidatus Omnitrophota bacterium]